MLPGPVFGEVVTRSIASALGVVLDPAKALPARP